jgi:hypothetical protein
MRNAEPISLRSVSIDLSELDATKVARQEATVVAPYTRRHERNVRLRWSLFALVALGVCVAAAVQPEQRRNVVVAAEIVLAPHVDRLVERVVPRGGGRCTGAVAYDAIATVRVGIDLERDDTEKAPTTPAAQPRRVKSASSSSSSSSETDDGAEEINQSVNLLKKAQDEASLQ